MMIGCSSLSEALYAPTDPPPTLDWICAKYGVPRPDLVISPKDGDVCAELCCCQAPKYTIYLYHVHDPIRATFHEFHHYLGRLTGVKPTEEEIDRLTAKDVREYLTGLQ